jgi:predicted AAA+ superfamily ATPase
MNPRLAQQQLADLLAGRVAQLELTLFQAREVLPPSSSAADLNPLWVRGGVPLSWPADDDSSSLRWREAFITTYLERDIPALANRRPRIPATILRREPSLTIQEA